MVVRAVPGARLLFSATVVRRGKKEADAQTTHAGGRRAQSLIMMGPVSLGSFNYMGRFVQTATRLPQPDGPLKITSCRFGRALEDPSGDSLQAGLPEARAWTSTVSPDQPARLVLACTTVIPLA